MIRCFGDDDALMRDYHDLEWGRPVVDERGLYEKLSLEAMQSGLSWALILRKRAGMRDAFAGFDPDVVATFGERDVERLLGDERTIRNRRKIEAIVRNAQATLALRSEGPPLERLLWAARPAELAAPATTSDRRSLTDESKAIAKALKQVGFGFVGPTTVYSTMQAVGLVNDHLADCFVRDEVQREQELVAG